MNSASGRAARVAGMSCWSRRRLLTGAAAGLAVPMVPMTVNADLVARVRELGLERFLPRAAPDNYIRYLAPLTQQADALARILVQRFVKAFRATGDLVYGETALMQVFVWWRAETSPEQRLRIARLGISLADDFAAVSSTHPAGPFWRAVHLGSLALTRGILDSLRYVPEVQEGLRITIQRSPDYFHRMPSLVQAKLLMKAPPFPVSIGNLRRSVELLERTPEATRRHNALWYLFRAEAALQLDGEPACLDYLDRMAREVTPVDVATAFLLDSSLGDADAFREVLARGQYNKYTWDPLLEPLRTGALGSG